MIYYRYEIERYDEINLKIILHEMPVLKETRFMVFVKYKNKTRRMKRATKHPFGHKTKMLAWKDFASRLTYKMKKSKEEYQNAKEEFIYMCKNNPFEKTD